MREGFVRLSRLVDFVALANRVPLALIGIHDLSGERLAHGDALAGISEFNDPTHREGCLAVRGNFKRNLVGSTTNSAGLDLETWLGVVHRALENIHRTGIRKLLR